MTAGESKREKTEPLSLKMLEDAVAVLRERGVPRAVEGRDFALGVFGSAEEGEAFKRWVEES